MKYDELLQTIGEFGRYQQLQYLLVCMVSITSAFHSMNMVFVGPTPQHRLDIFLFGFIVFFNMFVFSVMFSQQCCKIVDPPSEWQNLTEQQITSLSIPIEDGGQPSKCSMYNVSDIDWSEGNYSSWSEKEQRFSIPCQDGWTYSTEHYTSTIVSDWDLVCDSAWHRSMASTLFFVGRLVGALASGLLSDMLGRRPVFFISLLCQAAIGCLCAMATNIYVFYVLYFLQGIFQVAVYLCAYVLGTEAVGPSYRKMTGMTINIFYALGQVILTAMAMGIRRWKLIEVAISLPPLLFFVSWWFLPESIRWLMAHGKKDAAEAILQKSAKMNKVTLPPNIIDELDMPAPKEGATTKLKQMLKHWKFLSISLNVWFSWMINALVYYGLSLNTVNLQGDPYINFFIGACVEVPGLLIALALLDVIGRRWSMFLFMAVGGAGCICAAFIPQEYSWLVISTAMLGKLSITASYSTIYLMTAEVFPTLVRNAGMGIASVCARIGGMIAPQFLLLAEIYTPLPLLVFGAISFLGGALCLLLPETSGVVLPQDFNDTDECFHRHNHAVGDMDAAAGVPLKNLPDTKNVKV